MLTVLFALSNLVLMRRMSIEEFFRPW